MSFIYRAPQCDSPGAQCGGCDWKFITGDAQYVATSAGRSSSPCGQTRIEKPVSSAKDLKERVRRRTSSSYVYITLCFNDLRKFLDKMLKLCLKGCANLIQPLPPERATPTSIPASADRKESCGLHASSKACRIGNFDSTI